MSLSKIRTIFEKIGECDTWTLQLLQINMSKRNGISYVGREISIEPTERLKEFVNQISSHYIKREKGVLNQYVDVLDYDGTAITENVYKLKVDNTLIKQEYDKLIEAIAIPDKEVDPFDAKSQAYLLKGVIEFENEESPVKLISIQNPVVNLKNKFMRSNGKFYEISQKVLSLRPTIDVIIIGEYVYFLTFAGEKLFDMERSYKKVCSCKIEEIKECDIIVDMEMFDAVARTGHNPRRFIAYRESRLEKLKDKNFRREMAVKFEIPMEGDKFAPTEGKDVEKIVKLLCNKGMMDPFENVPVEVAGAKHWS